MVREEFQKSIKERFTKASPILLDALVLLAAAAFFIVSVICAGLAIRSALRGEGAGTAVRVGTAEAGSAGSGGAATPGAIWFSQPDGTFLTGDDLIPASPDPRETRNPAPPAVPVENDEAPPEQADIPAEQAAPDAGISTGRTAPGAQDWTVLVWTASDRAYHSRDDCGSIGPGGARQIQIQEAVALGYQRCGDCW